MTLYASNHKMRSAPIRYGTRYGCRFGQPHNMTQVHDDKHLKIERCMICNKLFRWKKGYKGRIYNVAYLQAHVRQYAQKFGSTKRVYHRIHNPDKMKITL